MPVEGPTQREYRRTADVLVGVFLAASSAVAYQIAPSTLEPKAQVQAKTLF